MEDADGPKFGHNCSDEDFGEDTESRTFFNSTSKGDYDFHLRIISTILHASILILGVPGNILLIVVAKRSKTLQTPTYCYLTSLAFADLLVLFSAVPECLVFVHVGKRWVAGEVGCALFVFVNFLGINAGSLSILAFTLERYFAIVYTPMTQNFCPTKRTKRIILGIWIAVVIYCSPWLGLTEVRTDPSDANHELCDFRVSNQVNMVLFATDFLIFYLFPLIVAVFVYSRIWLVLSKSLNATRHSSSIGNLRFSTRNLRVPSFPEAESSRSRRDIATGRREGFSSRNKNRNLTHSSSIIKSRLQVLPMLMVTVCFFAVAWLPFRGLLIYNAIVSEPWLDIWYLLFAKTMIYLNSAINPLLYNFMSRRFRAAVSRTLACESRYRRPLNPQNGFPLETRALTINRRGAYLTTSLSQNPSFPVG